MRRDRRGEGDGLVKTRDFEQIVMPHLDAAYNLAYWITRSRADAQDVVQDACLRALKYFDTFAGESPSAWLLTIVRRTCYTWLKRNRRSEETLALDDEVAADVEDPALLMGGHGLARDPETLMIEARDSKQLHRLIAVLPVPYREIIVLRELEELSYRDIADVIGIPIGTVMSRLARARALLTELWRREERE
jgi:RNA polymerase sigma-70 factor (ECF subfamily)